MPARLPIEEVLGDLLRAIETENQAVLQAPPGAGKTTGVPKYLLDRNVFTGRILMLEPRRLATRAAAERIAELCGSAVGEVVGYRMRDDTRTSDTCRIEVITEGILTRMIQSDPELAGVSCVIFDEFHERSLQGDLGLALCLEVRAALRPDLCLIVMSATLDAEPVAELMGNAPVITSEGKSYPVEERFLPRPWARPDQRGPRFEEVAARLVAQAVAETEGGVLAFLPGEGEIRRVESLLGRSLGPGVSVRPLYGALPFAKQRAAIAPVKEGRKVVLATSIAETSLTIEDIRVVVDCGRARRPVFDASTGMSRLVTDRVTLAEARQRAGRAGRVAEGVCYKMWTKGENGGLAAFAPPEIMAADLTGLVLELALWGATDPTKMPFLTQPRPADFDAAKALLVQMGALTDQGRITGEGRAMARMPVSARLAHMVLHAGPDGPLMAALLENRDVLMRDGGPLPSDLTLRWQAVKDPDRFEREHPFTVNRAAVKRIKSDARRLKSPGGRHLSVGAMAALAYPDRIGMRRDSDETRYLLSGGTGAVVPPGDALGALRLIVATDLDGARTDARVRIGTGISEAELRELFAEEIIEANVCEWSRRDRAVRARIQTRLGALVLEDRPWPDCPPEKIAAAMLDGLRSLDHDALPWTRANRLLQARIEWLRSRGSDLPDCSTAALLDRAGDWLLPYLGKTRTLADLKKLDMNALAQSWLTWDQMQTLDRLAPAKFTAPAGSVLAIDYSGGTPSVSVRLQEMFGTAKHPTIGPDHTPLQFELLSPAQRPLQTTSDLPRFWATSYSDVRKDMRGRYPKHVWPEDPTTETPTRRAKPRAAN